MRCLWLAAGVAGILAAGTFYPAASSRALSFPGDATAQASELVGTELVADLSKSVDAKKAKIGDSVKAEVIQDVLLHGKVVIRRGSKLQGHVVQAKARSKDDAESQLAVVFDKAILKGGGEINFAAAIRALAPAVRDDRVDQPDSFAPPIVGAQGNGPGPMGSGRSTTNNNVHNPGSPGVSQPTSAQAAQVGERVPVSTGKDSTSQSGVMGAGSRGVFGIPGLQLSLAPDGHGSIITSNTRNVKLDDGTQMVIQVNNLAP